MAKKMNFDKFAQLYCGTNCRNAQIEILCDSLLKDDNEINKSELLNLFNKDCEISQEYFEFNDYYDTYIKVNNIEYYCMSLLKF